MNREPFFIYFGSVWGTEGSLKRGLKLNITKDMDKKFT